MAEQIIGLLWQAEVELAQGRTVGEICRRLEVPEATFYRWRAESGGLKLDPARRLGVKTLFIEHGSPWENDNNESFNGELQDELLDREIFYSLREAEVLIERWRGTTTRSDRTARWATGRRPWKRCCPGRLAPPTLRSGRARRPGQKKGQVSHSQGIPYRGQVNEARIAAHC